MDMSCLSMRPAEPLPPLELHERASRRATPRRLGSLAAWLADQCGFQEETVALPVSGRRYAIRLPTEESRARLFAEAKRDPRRALPHWTRVWASGVALADVALARHDELRNQRVFELGSGLGVTATATLEAGAELVVADYASLALGFCRYNTLANVGRAPRTLRLNWRAPEPQALLRAEASGGFPIIMAADVLYESRDIAPLLALIERLLTPDGALWLAEPGRKTAQRFLYMLAAEGWQGVSMHADGPWHDGGADRVHIHILRRPARIDPFRGLLGGWR